jgi:hypothetical protein
MQKRVLPQLLALHQLRKFIKSLPVKRGHNIVGSMVEGHLYKPYKYTPVHILCLRLLKLGFIGYENEEESWEGFFSLGNNLAIFQKLARARTLHLYSDYWDILLSNDAPFRYADAYKDDGSPIREDEITDDDSDDDSDGWVTDSEGWVTDDSSDS